MATNACKIELLTIARDVLDRTGIYSSSGICRAITLAMHSDYSRFLRASLELKSYIAIALGNNTYLHQWMLRKGLVTTYSNVRNARLAWIDWMIGSLKGEH